MKMRIFLIVLVILVLIVLFVLYFNNRNRVEVSNIKEFSFSYSNGYAMNAYVKYDIECEDKCVASIKLDGEADSKKYDIDNKKVKELEDILKKYDVGKWNGFQKSNKHVLDGNSFTLSVKMENGDKIYATGYMMWPKHYKEVRDEIDKYFESIYKK